MKFQIWLYVEIDWKSKRAPARAQKVMTYRKIPIPQVPMVSVA
uniref:Transposase n=1 Tax=Ascaris lumbricoides TaxID=6252 RepID=A0A0M3IVC2_ASCLU